MEMKSIFKQYVKCDNTSIYNYLLSIGQQSTDDHDDVE